MLVLYICMYVPAFSFQSVLQDSVLLYCCFSLSYRTTILPSEADLEKMLDHFADFHIAFTEEHS